MFLASTRMAQRGSGVAANALTLSLRGNARGRLATTQVAYFSEEAKAPAAEEPTAAEKDASREEWGIKYDDECLKFEKEWKTISEAIEQEQMVYLEQELSDLQKKKVEMIADKVLDMNMFESRYLHAVMA